MERQAHIERINVILDGLGDSKVEYIRCLLEELFPYVQEDAQ